MESFREQRRRLLCVDGRMEYDEDILYGTCHSSMKHASNRPVPHSPWQEESTKCGQSWRSARVVVVYQMCKSFGTVIQVEARSDVFMPVPL